MGASLTSIITLLSREYLVLVGLSFLIIVAISWWLMKRWLETFPFKESIHVSVYLITGVAVMFISLLTILLSISKTSKTNSIALIKE